MSREGWVLWLLLKGKLIQHKSLAKGLTPLARSTFPISSLLRNEDVMAKALAASWEAMRIRAMLRS